jgi:HSP20 family protein
MEKKQTSLAPTRDPFTLLRQMTSDLDRLFDASAWPFRWTGVRTRSEGDATTWFPDVDVFEKDERLFVSIDLPGMKKEEVKVEVADGHLAIYGTRKKEVEEKKEHFYRCEREYGSFYREIPLPEGLKIDDVKATFADGVLEVSVPLPAKTDAKMRRVEIQEPAPAKAAA